MSSISQPLTLKRLFSHVSKRYHYTFQVTGELLGGTSSQIDPTRNKYEVASQLIIHLLMAASAGDETALKCAYQQGKKTLKNS